jgi:hypothetical protein
MSASVRGLEATVEWGTVDASGNFDDDNAKSKDISFTETFRSGTWTNTQVVLDGVPPTSLGFVRIRSVNNKAISLMR